MSRTQAARTASAIALLSLLLAACGGSGRSGSEAVPAATPAATTAASAPVAVDTATDPAGDVTVAGADPMDDLCSLVPADAAATALGEAVDGGASKRSVTFDNASCRYLATGSDASLTIWFYPDLTEAEWEATLDKTGMADQSPVDGLGDAAFVRPEASGGTETKLAVLAGRQVVWVIVASAADPTARAGAAETIARIVLAGGA